MRYSLYKVRMYFEQNPDSDQSHARSAWCLKLHRSLRLHCDANQCASDTLADSRVQNQNISSPFLFPRRGVWGEPKKWKGIFWFCFVVSVSEKSTIILSYLTALFSALTATEAHPYPRSVVTLITANHTQPPTHSPLASLALAASALCVFAW